MDCLLIEEYSKETDLPSDINQLLIPWIQLFITGGALCYAMRQRIHKNLFKEAIGRARGEQMSSSEKFLCNVFIASHWIWHGTS